jgi:hypothetical protein
MIDSQWQTWADEGNGQYAVAVAIVRLARAVEGLNLTVSEGAGKLLSELEDIEDRINLGFNVIASKIEGA